ncbi:PSD1 and planctomycete cytochrome C domain-containing protein [Tautonia marina]|uniref:PSD1 and planctomycete cytochrome C domain-containing protein n=1 Tax=Tautonia marina TaxID=2653855 RepID=UPI001260A2F8|nr:PSD1 and planctomycete cytochrome C domain-containing protein [Tautonia marina]
MSVQQRDGWRSVCGRWAAMVLAVALTWWSPLASTGKAQEAPDFNREVRPILTSQCLPCHGPDEAERKGNLRLDLREDVVRDRDGYAVVVPGDPEASELIFRIESDDPIDQMPPPESGHELSAEDQELLRRWIMTGAEFDTHWSFRPLIRPELPKLPEALEEGVLNPVDVFVRSRLAQVGLEPEPEADRYTLARRLALDLTGVPLSPEEVERFVNDDRPDAYERLVERLLDSPRFGEHWARTWLDLARYADTKGYEKDQPRTMWRYRDWVIEAINDDMPFDRFTIEQLAGDLLPDPTDDQILATAFHRNTMTNDEGGTDDEEFRVAAVKDRVDTTMQVWMGLTMGCAKCHSHKFDPISQRDYYAFYAIFNQTEDADRFDDAPTRPMPTPWQSEQSAALEARLAELREAFWRDSPEQTERQRAWESAIAKADLWRRATITKAEAASRASLEVREDASVLVSGPHEDRETLTLELVVPERVTAVRLEVLKDPSLPQGGPGRAAHDRNAVISEFRLAMHSVGDEADPVVLEVSEARADFEQKGYSAAFAVDGNPETGWAWAPKNDEPHVILLTLAEPLEMEGARLVVTIEQNYPRLQLGCFRISTTDTEDPKSLEPQLRSLEELAAQPIEERTSEDQQRLNEAYRRNHEPTASIHAQIEDTEAELKTLQETVARTPILQELPDDRRRTTRIHQRGNFLEPGEEVSPSVPDAFGSLPRGRNPDRLAVARWLVSEENPLTARVAVNRVWARIMGVGLVETEEDFGLQGAPPTHPELLDWLAIAYRDELGWSLKNLCRLLVNSSTYRQSSRQDPSKVEADPRNELLSRSPRFRLPAETIRDQALAVAGLLSTKVGGPSVMPPQPPGLWRAAYSTLKWETSTGEDRHRRALYTFLRRTSPYPSMTTFDAGSGEVCTIRRVRTNTPLQALVTLNDPAFVEAAAALGRRMATEAGPNPRTIAAQGVQLALGRPATETEVERLDGLFHEAIEEFRAEPGAADAFLESANAPACDEGVDPMELAAWAVVGNVLLNLDETLTRP